MPQRCYVYLCQMSRQRREIQPCKYILASWEPAFRNYSWMDSLLQHLRSTSVNLSLPGWNDNLNNTGDRLNQPKENGQKDADDYKPESRPLLNVSPIMPPLRHATRLWTLKGILNSHETILPVPIICFTRDRWITVYNVTIERPALHLFDQPAITAWFSKWNE